MCRNIPNISIKLTVGRNILDFYNIPGFFIYKINS